jgi:hypothetical protein
VGLAADFVTGQGARLVIGQTTFTSQTAGASDTLLGGVGGLAMANGKLFIADSNRMGLTPLNHRVLMMDTTRFPQPLNEIPAGLGRCPVCVGKADLVLGQSNFTDTAFKTAADGFRLPTAVATDGTMLAVSDTQNNRVLIWRNLPTSNGQPADIVLGQPGFTAPLKRVVVDAKSLRAPQGVWIQNGRMFVADTQNHRVLIWNSLPTTNEQPADVVVGQADMNAAVEPDLTLQVINAQPDRLLNPVSVTSDGVRLYVTDLGHNRVLIWNSIPTRNGQPADLVIGQKDFVSAIANDAPGLCQPRDDNADGQPDKDEDGNLIYPVRCGRTLNFPRFALSDGQRLFIADGGNDRVLIFNQIPTQNSPAADVILGQPDEFSSVVSSVTDLFNPLLRQSAADIIATPTSLAWDGRDLYVTDPSNRRILVFTAGEFKIPLNGVRNAASREVFALGSIGVRLAQTFNPDGTVTTGKITEGDKVTVKIRGRAYVYTVKGDDTLESILIGLQNVINAGAGDREVFARYEPALGVLKLQAKIGGTQGNEIGIEATVSENAGIAVATSGATLRGGQNASVIAPGTIVTMKGSGLARTTAVADLSQFTLPRELGDVEAYFDGIRSPLLYVSPDQVNAVVPYEVLGSNNISFYLRIRRDDGTVFITTPLAVPVDEQNPGIFAFEGEEPRTAVAFHATSYATGTITVDGNVEEGDVGTITIEDRKYSYTVKADDTLDSVRDALVALINANPEEVVEARAVGAFHRIQLVSKIPGPAGEGTTFSATSSEGDNNSVFLILSSTSAALCCANVEGALVTTENPAVPGETIYIYATGVGPVDPQVAFDATVTGQKYTGPALNTPREFVSSLGGGSTANVISAGLEPGTHNLYRVVLEIGQGLQVSGPYAALTISQFIYTSNTVNLPVRNPNRSTQGQ